MVDALRQTVADRVFQMGVIQDIGENEAGQCRFATGYFLGFGTDRVPDRIVGLDGKSALLRQLMRHGALPRPECKVSLGRAIEPTVSDWPQRQLRISASQYMPATVRIPVLRAISGKGVRDSCVQGKCDFR
jgi:hypothetical protein